jgi:hypothetical protein
MLGATHKKKRTDCGLPQYLKWALELLLSPIECNGVNGARLIEIHTAVALVPED